VQEANNQFKLRFLLQEITLVMGEFTIGRSSNCHLTLQDPLVSRRHVKITSTVQDARIEDLGSRNGTLVNGAPIFAEQQLRHADRIRVGTHSLVFIEGRFETTTRSRVTAHLVLCGDCGAPYPRSSDHCPHCNSTATPMGQCPKCGNKNDLDARFCSMCGRPLRSDERLDNTMPISLEEDASSQTPLPWTNRLLLDNLERSLKLNRYEQARRIFDACLDQFSSGALEDAAIRDLKRICRICAASGDPDLSDHALTHLKRITRSLPEMETPQ
jgi:hypothetical protein